MSKSNLHTWRRVHASGGQLKFPCPPRERIRVSVKDEPKMLNKEVKNEEVSSTDCGIDADCAYRYLLRGRRRTAITTSEFDKSDL